MDVFARRIIGFGVAPADLDGPVICRMFNRAIATQTPTRDHNSPRPRGSRVRGQSKTRLLVDRSIHGAWRECLEGSTEAH